MILKWTVRFILMASLIAALANPVISTKKTGRRWIVLLDISDSNRVVHDSCQSSLLAFYQNKVDILLSSLAKEDELGVIFFGDGAEIAATPTLARKRMLPSPTIAGGDSRLADAIRLGLSLPGTNRSLVFIIYSDGNISQTSVTESNDLLLKNQIEASWHSALPDGIGDFADACLKSLYVPGMADENSHISGHATVQVTKPGIFRVTISSSHRIWKEQVVEMTHQGSFRSHFTIAATDSNREQVEAKVESLSFVDGCHQNNARRATIQITAKPHILWVGEICGDFAADRFEITSVKPEKFGDFLGGLGHFQAIVIVDGNCAVLGKAFAPLEQYVLRGGGLWIMGNTSTLGPGGYGGTLLENVLPVWCVPEKKNPAACQIVLDISGSMGEKPLGISKLQQAKMALAQSLQVLSKEDMMSLIVFHAQPRLMIPFHSVGEIKQSLGNTLENIYARGGTQIVPALQLALANFNKITGRRKHMMLISDGISGEETDVLMNLVDKIQAEQITLSVIATGDDPMGLLQQMAREGHGNFYRATSDFTSFVTEDIKQVLGSLVHDEEQTVSSVANTMLEGDLSDFQGHTITSLVRVTTKDWGRTLLETPKGHPVLVCGYYGLGRSAVLSTNLSVKWGKTLASDRGLQLVRSLLSWLVAPHFSPWELTCTAERDHLKVTLVTRGGLKTYHNLSLQMKISWESEPVFLREVGYSIYEGICAFPNVGEHKIAIQEYHEKTATTRHIADFQMAYGREYQNLGLSPMQLPEIHRSQASGKRDITSILLGCAAFLFLVERSLHFLRRSP